MPSYHFGKGNPGRPKGAIGMKNRAMAVVCRELVEGKGDNPGLLQEVVTLWRSMRTSPAKAAIGVKLLEGLMSYGYGKPPVKVILPGDLEESPDGQLREIMRKRNEQLALMTSKVEVGEDGDGKAN